MDHEYSGLEGDVNFVEHSLKLAYGKDYSLIKNRLLG